jgi:hypothetical protein
VNGALTVPAASPATAGSLLERAASAVRTALPADGPLSVGIDLGTATCVLVVVDASGQPVWVDSRPTAAVRDGVVVDFFGARDAVAALASDAETALGIRIERAGTAHPPGVPLSDANACRFVLESAGIEEVVLTDEVSAAQRALGIVDGVLVDVAADRPGSASSAADCSSPSTTGRAADITSTSSWPAPSASPSRRPRSASARTPGHTPPSSPPACIASPPRSRP